MSQQPSDHNAVPDADPDDVPAWLTALRAGQMVNTSPGKDAQPWPVAALAASVLARHRVPSVPTSQPG